MVYTIAWTVDTDGDWSQTSNWTPGRAPKSTDNVHIDTADHHTVSFIAGSATVKSLVVGNDDFAMTGGTLSLAAASSFANALTIGNATLTLGGATSVAGLFTGNDHGTIAGTGAFTLAGDAMFGGGSQLMTGAGTTLLKGTTTLSSGDILGLDHGRVLENQGTLTESGISAIALGHNPLGSSSGNATLLNDASGTLIFDNASLDIAVQSDKGTTSLVNAGAIQNIGAGDTQISAAFNNTGTVSVTNGQFEILGHMTGSGTVSVGAGATFVLNATTFSAQNLVTIASNAGTVHLTGGSGDDTFAFTGQLHAADSLAGNGNTDTLDLTGDYAVGLTFSSTTLVGINHLNVGAGFNYNLTTNDATVGSSATFKVDASALASGNALTFNGAAETNGYFNIIGGAGNDVLTGGAKGDTFDLSHGGNDTVVAGAGNDMILVGAALTATDAIDGGVLGSDTVNLKGDYSSGLTLSPTTITNVENLTFATGFNYNITTNDATVGSGQTLNVDATGLGSTRTLTFNGAAETDGHFNFIGGAGNEVLTGGAMSDTFTGSTGIDAMSGGGGDDTIHPGGKFTAADTIDGGDGNDTLFLDGSYVLSHAVVMTPTTLTNVETIVLGNSATTSGYTLTTNDATVAAGHTLTVDASALNSSGYQVLTFNGSAETNGTFVVTGGGNDDIITGGAGVDTLNGDGGNDTLDGGAGADVMTGGTGYDTYIVDNPGDVIVEAAVPSIDTVRTSLASYTLPTNVEELIYTGSSDFTGTGNSRPNIITGGSGNDVLNGGGGVADVLHGGLGNDTYIVNNTGVTIEEAVNAGIDTVHTSLAKFTLSGNVENLVYTGSSAFTGTGNTLNNTITGGAGNDTLRGGAGADLLTGGNGADHFAFAAAKDSTHASYDTITDFNAASDKFDVSGKIAAVDDALTTGALSTATFDANLAAAVNASHLGIHHAVLFTADSGTLAGEEFLVVDLNGTAGYQAGADLVVHLTGESGTIVTGDFI